MKGSLIIVAFFVAGVILARWDVLPQELLQQDFSMYVLYGLMFLVGISIGSDRKAWAALKGQQLRIVPVSYTHLAIASAAVVTKCTSVA